MLRFEDDPEGFLRCRLMSFSRLLSPYDTDYGESYDITQVILATFDPGQSSAGLPPRLVPDLLSRFSTSEAYELYPDVLGFFHFLSRLKSRELASPWTDIIIGIITNSDDRVPSILTSLGLRVGSTRISTNSQPLKQIYQKGDDINFVVMSYDVGVEKPDHRIFDAAKALANATPTAETSQDVFMHVGDDLEKDSMGATNAGWKGLYLGGFGRMDAQAGDSRGPFVEDLRQLEQYLRPGAD